MEGDNGHFTWQSEAIERVKWVSDVRYEVYLTLEKKFTYFFAQYTVHFTLKSEGLTKDTLKNVFLNSSALQAPEWIFSVVLNGEHTIERDQVLKNQRICFDAMHDQLLSTSKKDKDGNLRVSLTL